MANVGYINGFPDGTYRPNEAVTANQLCQIMLNILGYDIDTSVSWATAVQAKSFSIGLLKNVSGTVGAACSRQEAAQIIYNALNMDILAENALGVKVPSGETILTKYLNGYTASVVVTGNEKADLNGKTPLDAGKTEVDGKTTLNWSTDLDAIGSAYTIWATKGGANNDDTVVYAELGNNTYYETHDATNGAISAKDAGMKLTGAATYINFDDGLDEYYTADMVITYSVDGNKIALTDPIISELKKYGYDVTNLKKDTDLSVPATKIKAGDPVDDDTLAIIHYIFANYNDADGKVSVGTQTTDDISNTISFSKFVSNYLTPADTKYTAPANENGNYIKVIDNDGDGVAEYILKTKYNMDVVTNISARGEYTLAIEGSVKDAVSSEDELAAGDVIVYALIDGVYYANQAEVKTITIDKKGIDYKAKTITDGETTYGQSGIEPVDDTTNAQTKFNNAFLYDTFKFDVTDASVETAYDLYLDNYGFVRAYTTNKYTNGLGLLTDAYYGTDNRVDTAKVTMVTADTEATDYDVAAIAGKPGDAKYANFIDTTEGGDNGNRGTWKRLNTMGTGFTTNVAAYSESDGVLTLGDPTTASYSNKVQNVVKEVLALTSTDTMATRTFTTTESKTVRVTTDTVYYYVSANGAVSTWTGYENSPKKLTLDADQGDIAYTVATQSKVANATYYYANVIVIEAKSSNSNVYFGYYSNTKTGTDASYWLNAVGPYTDDDDNTVYGKTTEKIEKFTALQTTPAFYKITGKNVNYINSDYNKNGIYAATVLTGADIYNRNYIELDNKVGFYPSTVPVYVINKDNNANTYLAYTATEMDTNDIQVNDKLVYFVVNKQVVYAIDATASEDGRLGTTDVTALWKLINAEQNPKPVATIPASVALDSAKLKSVDVDLDALELNSKGYWEVTTTVPYSLANENTDILRLVVTPTYSAATVKIMDAQGKDITTAESTKKTAVNNGTDFVVEVTNGTDKVTYEFKVTVGAEDDGKAEIAENLTDTQIRVSAVAANAGTIEVMQSHAATTGLENALKALKATGNAVVSDVDTAKGTATVTVTSVDGTLTVVYSAKVVTAFTLEAADPE
jgi:hypothetical protein